MQLVPMGNEAFNSLYLKSYDNIISEEQAKIKVFVILKTV